MLPFEITALSFLNIDIEHFNATASNMHVAAKKPPTTHTYTTILPYCLLSKVASPLPLIPGK